ncbi:MAG: hypothetical protein SNJ09_00915 [Rikenellaceae bacterium]
MKKLLLSFGRKAGLVMLVAAALAVTSCRTSSSAIPPIPETVEGDTVEECYYIIGTLTSGGSALGGATVSAGGATATTASTGEYRLTIEKENFASKTTVSFSKSDYLTVESTAMFPSSDTGTKVTVDATLTRKAAAVEVDTETPISVGSTTTTTTVTIAANVVKPGTTLSTTPYTPGNTATVVSSETSTSEKTISNVTSPVSVLAMEYDPAIIEDSSFTINMSIDNSEMVTKAASEGYAFSSVKAVKYENSAWTSLKESTPDFTNSQYKVTVHYDDLTDGKTINVSISPSFTVVASESTSEKLIEPFVIDNIGKTSIVSQEVSYTMKQGLVFDDCTCEDSKYCSDTIKSELAAYLATMLGASFTNSTLTFTETVNVSGDSKVTVGFNQSYRTYSITASVCPISDDGTLESSEAKSVTYKAKYYGAVTRGVEEEAGDMGFTHND